jgi:hypothetical protein
MDLSTDLKIYVLHLQRRFSSKCSFSQCKSCHLEENIGTVKGNLVSFTFLLGVRLCSYCKDVNLYSFNNP